MKIICRQNSIEGPNKDDFSIKIYLNNDLLDLYTDYLPSYNSICLLFNSCVNLAFKRITLPEQNEDFSEQFANMPAFDRFGFPILKTNQKE